MNIVKRMGNNLFTVKVHHIFDTNDKLSEILQDIYFSDKNQGDIS